jgi:hypothetical protein
LAALKSVLDKAELDEEIKAGSAMGLHEAIALAAALLPSTDRRDP